MTKRKIFAIVMPREGGASGGRRRCENNPDALWPAGHPLSRMMTATSFDAAGEGAR